MAILGRQGILLPRVMYWMVINVHPGEQGGGADVPKGGISEELKQDQPSPQQDQKESLIGHFPPALQEFYPEFFENSVLQSIVCLRAYSTLLDNKGGLPAQLNSIQVVRKCAGRKRALTSRRCAARSNQGSV